MSKEIEAVAANEVVTNYGASILAVIERAARDPNVDIDKMERLLAMQERIQERDAKQAFTAAKIAMRPNLPEITMKGMIVIKKDGRVMQETPFPRFEDLHELVVPVLSENGFDLKFKNGLSPDGKVRVTTILSHLAGHEDETHFDLPHDSSGSKNPVQAVGSSTKYGMRYGTIAILNLRVVGDDDDGVAGGAPPALSDEAFAKITQLIEATDSNVTKMFSTLGIEAANLRELTKPDYNRCVDALNSKLAKMAKAETDAKAATNG